MADMLDLAMLICASMAAMAFGVFAAYFILRVGFAMMRGQRRTTPVKAQTEAARIT